MTVREIHIKRHLLLNDAEINFIEHVISRSSAPKLSLVKFKSLLTENKLVAADPEPVTRLYHMLYWANNDVLGYEATESLRRKVEEYRDYLYDNQGD